MVEGARGPRLLLEAPQPVGVRGERGRQDLDRHLAPELAGRARDRPRPCRRRRSRERISYRPSFTPGCSEMGITTKSETLRLGYNEKQWARAL